MRNLIKYIIGIVTVLILRLMPHPPNVEPIMATMMPFSKKWSWIGGLIFTLCAILIYDLITKTLGVWTIMTATTYGLLAVTAGFYFKKRKSTMKNYVIFAIIGTIIYDLITGIGMGVLIFGMPLSVTVIGQIPFTLYHLAGNLIFSALLSPLIFRWVLSNEDFDLIKIIEKIKNIKSA